MFRPRLIAAIVFAATARPVNAQELDTARALSALRDAKASCEADRGLLWGRSLCGPIALADRQTRLVIANDTVERTSFIPLSGAYIMTLPPNQYVANTSFEWGKRAWTMVMLPLPADRFTRVALVMHEVFHREQAALHLRQPDALNNQLDMRTGRTWLRLEYRALARALETLPDTSTARRHIESALLFRAARRAYYPGSDSLEATLEIQEGLAEYTGQRLALQLTGEPVGRVAKYVRDYEKTPTFVRAFAYGSGPAIGLLLDAFDPSWRTEVITNRDIGNLLAHAIHFKPPRNLTAVARGRADEYGWSDVDRSEATRDSARAPLLREYRARLAEGPTISLRQSKDSLSWSYDPTELIAFDLYSTIYPSGEFSGPWGKLSVENGGVLVRNDFSSITIGAPPAPIRANTRQLKGNGWLLTLNSGWSLLPDPARLGSFVVAASR